MDYDPFRPSHADRGSHSSAAIDSLNAEARAGLWKTDSTFTPPKNEGAAILLTLAGVLVPLAVGRSAENFEDVLLGGVLLAVGPSAGQFYAGSPGTALSGIVIRGLGAAAVIGGVADCLGTILTDESCAAPLVYVGVGMIGAGIAFSLFDAKRAVDRANARAYRVHKASFKTSFAPALLPIAGNRLVPGLAMNLSF